MPVSAHVTAMVIGPIHLASHGVIELAGPDAASLLQGLLTQDIVGQPVGSVRHGAMLTPQGKYLFDALVFRLAEDRLLLDCVGAEALARRLMMYRLRAQVTISPRPDLVVLMSGSAPEDALAAGPDPRHPALGWRVIAGALPAGAGSEADYTALRLEAGIPELAMDLEVEKDFALEGLLDELNGVDFHKGCYVGQEMTSRMKRRTTVRTKLVRVRYEGAAPAWGTALEAGGWEVGRMRSGIQGVGIALLRLDRALPAVAAGTPILAGATPVLPDPPEWLVVPEVAGG